MAQLHLLYSDGSKEIDTEINTEEIPLEYGGVSINDVPLVVPEESISTYARLAVWLAIIILVLWIIMVLAYINVYEQKQKKYLSTKTLFKNSSGERLNTYFNKENIKCIDISIPKNNKNEYLDSDRLGCLFEFYVVLNSGVFSKLRSEWHIDEQSFFVRLYVERYVKIQSLYVYVSPTQLSAAGLQDAFKILDIKVRDNHDRIVWQDIIATDFFRGDSSYGAISGGYLPVYF